MDLSNLSDDQLLQLIKAAMAETVLRGEAIIYAANRSVSDAAQELRTKAAAGQTATASTRSTVDDLAADKAAMVQALLEADWFATYATDPFSINMWEKRGEVRIYIQKSFTTPSWEFTYFHTGNPWNYQGTIKSEDPLVVERLIFFCKAICDRHLPGFKCYSNAIKNSNPDPQALAFYRQAINKVKVPIS
jgi:hypothetical protein